MIIGSQRPTVGGVWHHAKRAAPVFGGHRRVAGTAPRAVRGGGPAPWVKGGDTPMRLDSFNIDGPFVKVKGSATLREASAPDAIVLFDIGAQGTPFTSGGDFTNIRTSVGQSFVMDHPERPASSFVQYVGVFRNSDWAPPRPE